MFRYRLIRWKIRRYFKKDENDRHIEHYIEHCSLGDWLVLYQMSRNMNKRFFADFISVLSKTVNPHLFEECHEHHHFIKDPRLEKVTNICFIIVINYIQIDANEKQKKDSALDITFIDKDVEDMKENKVIGPKDLVDIMA